MRIFAGYEVTEEPWGGANNFLRALYKELKERHGAEIVYTPDSSCDVFFFGQMGRGPLKGSEQYSIEDLKRISALNPNAPVIMRMVNTKKHSSHNNIITYLLNSKDRKIDSLVVNGARLCDGLVFQTGYQKKFFEKFGLYPKNWKVIHNGAARDFSDFEKEKKILQENQPLMVFSSTFSTKSWKNHEVIAKISEIPNVTVLHAGAWPEIQDKKNVTCLGTITHKEILDIISKSHFYLHPAYKEVCSNSIIESLAAGLPVLYGNKPSGSKEIVGENGIMLDESDLEKSIREARARQPELVERLKKERSAYGMARAADEYFDFFKSMIEKKSLQKAV